MGTPPLSREDAELAVEALAATSGNASQAARNLGLPRGTFDNRLRAAERLGIGRAKKSRTSILPDVTFAIPDPDNQDEDFLQPTAPQKRGRLFLDIDNGVVLIGGDCHYWPDHIPVAHKAFVKLCRELKPSVIVMNGDVFDGASISRHPSIEWETRPTVTQEIEACKIRLQEIREAAPKAKPIWTLGNHDARFESRLAQAAPEYARVHGVHLRDHFPDWQPCWSVWINHHTVIKHRFSGGAHAAYNNALKAGKNIFTNHLHRPNVRGFSDYNGRRYGVDTGCIADPSGPQFNYTEDNPLDWCGGFAVATIHKRQLLMPELCEAMDERHVQFRAQVIEV